MNRRNFLKLLGSTSTFAISGACVSSGNDISPDLRGEAEEVLLDESDKGWSLDKWAEEDLPSEFKDRAVVGRNWSWWDFPQEAQPLVLWPLDEDAADYSHLLDYDIGEKREFSLSVAGLLWLAERNSFELLKDNPRIVFGLRGCTIASSEFDTMWGETIDLVTARPNHSEFRCVIGVADFDTGQLRAFSASTVPEAAYMYGQIEKNRGCNLLPTGLYAYRVGTHNASATKTPQIGALRLDGLLNPTSGASGTDIVVLRTLDNLSYDLSDEHELWDRCRPFDNIHASIWSPSGLWRDGLVSPSSSVFSSAGCQVIRGAYTLNRSRKFTAEPTDQWAEFRKALGLGTKSGKATKGDYGALFQYMLLTGDEAYLASATTIKARVGYRRLRFGSTGELVKEVQRDAGDYQDGVFGPGTTVKVLKQQVASGKLRPTPIVSV
jgi:hypothetical protein